MRGTSLPGSHMSLRALPFCSEVKVVGALWGHGLYRRFLFWEVTWGPGRRVLCAFLRPARRLWL